MWVWLCCRRLVSSLVGQVFSRAAARAVKQQLATPRALPPVEDGSYSSYSVRNTAGQPQSVPPQLVRPSIPQVLLDGSSPAYVSTPTVGASRTSISVGPGPIPDGDGYGNGSENGLQRGPSNGVGSAGSNGLQDGAADMLGEAEGSTGNSSSARGSDGSRGVIRKSTSMRKLEPVGAA